MTIKLLAASEITFSVPYRNELGQDYEDVIKDLCIVAPHILRVDGDLAEMYDGNLDRKPKYEDLMALARFKDKYHGLISPREALDHLR